MIKIPEPSRALRAMALWVSPHCPVETCVHTPPQTRGPICTATLSTHTCPGNGEQARGPGQPQVLLDIVTSPGWCGRGSQKGMNSRGQGSLGAILEANSYLFPRHPGQRGARAGVLPVGTVVWLCAHSWQAKVFWKDTQNQKRQDGLHGQGVGHSPYVTREKTEPSEQKGR